MTITFTPAAVTCFVLAILFDNAGLAALALTLSMV